MKTLKNILIALGLLAGIGSAAQNCSGSFVFTINDMTVDFNGTVSMNVTNIVWSFGDMTYDNSNQVNVQHTYTQPGTYTVCIIVQDSAGNCFDSSCAQITVIPQSCQASFTYIDSLAYVFFINTSSLGSNGLYAWDFGDGNYSSMFSPSHAYAQPGQYMVTLFAYDTTQNFCDSTMMLVLSQSNAQASGISEGLSAIYGVQLAPNPAAEKVTIGFNLATASDITVQLLDLSGRTVRNFGAGMLPAGFQQQELSIADLAAGTYLVRIESAGQYVHQKLVIAHHL